MFVAGYLPYDFDPSQWNEAWPRYPALTKRLLLPASEIRLCLGAASRCEGRPMACARHRRPYLETKGTHRRFFGYWNAPDMERGGGRARKGVAATRGRASTRIFFNPSPDYQLIADLTKECVRRGSAATQRCGSRKQHKFFSKGRNYSTTKVSAIASMLGSAGLCFLYGRTLGDGTGRRDTLSEDGPICIPDDGSGCGIPARSASP